MSNFLQILANGLIAGAVYAVVGLGFGIVYQVQKFFDLSYAATLTIAVFAAYSAVASGLPVWALPLVSMTVAAFTGSLAQLLVFDPLRNRGASPVLLILASLGLMIVITNLISLFYGDSPLVITNSVDPLSIDVLGVSFTPVRLCTLLVALGISVFCWWVFGRTFFGLKARAVANDSYLASCVGTETHRVLMQSIVLGSAAGGLIAALFALDAGITPLLGFQLLLMGVVATIVGGIGRLEGAALGGMIIGIIQHLFGWWVSIAWQDAFVFVILIFFLLLRPQGFLGKPSRKVTV